jgi:hypothetical protein
MKMTGLKPGLLLGAIWLASFSAHALDGMVIANESVTVTNLTPAMVRDIYTGKTMYWAGGQAIVLVVAGNATDAAIQEASGMSPTQFRTHWQRLGFSGRGQPPKKSEDIERAIALVRSTRGAVAIVPRGTEAKGLKSIEVR